MIKNTVIALDLAKSIIQVAEISPDAEVRYNKAMSPDKVRKVLAKSKACIVALEGCGSAQYWARYAEECGHEVRMMSPRRVKAFIPGQKNDHNDAIGIGIASQQLGMHFCTVKTLEQQTIQSLNSSRRFLVKSETALNNHIRALIYEYGLTVPRGAKGLATRMAELLAPECQKLSPAIQTVLRTLWTQFQHTKKQLTEVTKQLDSLTLALEPCKRLQSLEGVGPKSASLLYAAIGNGKSFKNGREAAVNAGVTPKQYSSGGKSVLLGITKCGDTSLRSTMYQGALSYITKLKDDPKTEKQKWLIDLVRRAGLRRTCIALVNKNIRTAWAMLKYKTEYQPTCL